MQTIQRSTANAARQFQRSARQQPRRYAHDAHGSTHHAHHGPTTESFGRGFYITIGLIPASFALYKFSGQGTDGQPYLTRLINSYDSWREQWTKRNDLHTQMIEQAARDRNLFLNSPGSRHIELKYPEMLNSGSPFNVPAGHGSANIDHVIAKYEKEAFEENERKLQALRDNNIKAEKPYQAPAGNLAQ